MLVLAVAFVYNNRIQRVLVHGVESDVEVRRVRNSAIQ